MSQKINRVISILLVFLILINTIGFSVPVYGAPGDANETAANFLNFYQDSNAVDLNMQNLTTNDYYTMFNYMSNWYKPGTTTLYDVKSASGDFYSSFEQALKKSGDTKLKDLVMAFGADVVNGINSGKCLIVDSTGKKVDGVGFLDAIYSTVESSETNFSGAVPEFKSSKLYFENTSHTAFDFSANAMRAAFQTVFAYNPDLFLMDYGIASLDVFFLDAVGNLWGGTDACIDPNYVWDSGYSQGNCLLDTDDALKSVYLILPACLNPSAFTPGATSQEQLRMPLMNRFVLSAIVTYADLQAGGGDAAFDSKFIPIYEALSYINPDLKSSILNVVGVHSLSPLTFNLSGIESGNPWTSEKRKQNLADFVYNSNSFVVEADTSNKGMLSKYATYSYIVFATSLENLNGKGSQKAIDGVMDLQTGVGSFADGGGTQTFNVADTFTDIQKLAPMQKYLAYFGTPTILNLSNVSMNFYKYEENGSGDDLATQFAEYFTTNNGVTIKGLTNNGLTSSEISKMGLNGMSLFLNDANLEIEVNEGNGKRLFLLSPEYMVKSKFSEMLEDGIGNDRKGGYDTVTKGNVLPSDANLANIFFLQKFNNGTTGAVINKYSTMNGTSTLKGNMNNIRVIDIDNFKVLLSALNSGANGAKLIYQDTLATLENAGSTAYSSEAVRKIASSIGGIYDYSYIQQAASGGMGMVPNYTYPGPSTNLDNQWLGTNSFSSESVWNELNGKSTSPKDGYAKLDMDSEIPMIPYFTTISDSDGNITKSGITEFRIFLNQGNVVLGTNSGGSSVESHSIVYMGSTGLSGTRYSVMGRLLSGKDTQIFKEFSTHKGRGEKNTYAGYIAISAKSDSNALNKTLDYLMALYGYNLFFPSSYLFDGNSLFGNTRNAETLGSFEKTSGLVNSSSSIKMRALNGDYLMGMYLGYMVDMMGLGTCDEANGLSYGNFSSIFLPSYSISAKGGTLNMSSYMGDTATGVTRSEDTSFEEMQKDLISRIYGLTSSEPNSYRDGLIINILNGVILAIHRTITGTWGADIATVTSGASNTYQNVTGYIYTPTLEELPFTATMMDNYLEIYILCMLFVIYILVLMVLLHMRSWREGILTCVIMSVALLLPYILISNCVNVSNKISDNIFSDRFDFWALVDHSQKAESLTGYNFIDRKDQWYAEANATADSDIIGAPGVKIKWMSPKKVDNFQQIYSSSDYSDSFVTNMTIFKWLFNSTIYDSEFVNTDVFGSYVYREYTTIALEAESYYNWGNVLKDKLQDNGSIIYNGNSYTVPTQFANTLTNIGENNIKYFEGGIGRADRTFFTGSNAGSKLSMSDEKLDDILAVAQSQEGYYSATDADSDKIGMWGILSDGVNTHIKNLDTDKTGSGIVSNLPTSSMATNKFDSSSDPTVVSQAIFLKNTESPYYYFYSVLKSRYEDGSTGNFKNALLRSDMFKVDTVSTPFTLNSGRNIHGAFRDYLDLEGLFEYVIPYLKLSNDYVAAWQKVNGTEIPDYNFKYSVDENGDVIDVGVDKATGNLASGAVDENGVVDVAYQEAVQDKNARNRVWNMYSPWVDSLYLTDTTEKISFINRNIYIQDTLNPYAYFEHGRPMIFSEADMIAKGYNYSDLTEVERKMQAVLEKTYKDLLYLINYYSLDDDILLSAAAMYATFNFNAEFSDNNFLQPSVMLYPQSFELRNFNYDAYIRLALLNTTGESIFAEEDLYERIIRKTSIFTGILLIVSDLVACILIPLIKFIMLVALLFLGLLVCVSCVLNPPEKIYQNTLKYVLVPTFAFTALNIIFAFCMSLVVGEGLTAYVGSKSLNLATNDPTTTLFIMALFGIAYVFVAWKIMKMVIDAYKQFGLSSFITAVGVMSSAVAAATAGVAKKGMKAIGGGIIGAGGAAVGMLTAEKGEKLAGAFEGATLGARGVIDRRIRDKRILERMGAGEEGTDSNKVTNSINQKASSPSGDSSSSTKDTKVNETPSTHSSDESSLKVKVKKVQKQRADKSLNNIQVERRKTGTPIQSKIDGKSYQAKDIVLKPIGSSAPMDKNKKVYINGNVSNVKKPSTNSVKSVRVSSSSKSKIDKKY